MALFTITIISFNWRAHEVVGTTGAPEEHQKLASGVPVFLTYITAKVDDGSIVFTPDPYDRDDLRQGG